MKVVLVEMVLVEIAVVQVMPGEMVRAFLKLVLVTAPVLHLKMVTGDVTVAPVKVSPAVLVPARVLHLKIVLVEVVVALVKVSPEVLAPAPVARPGDVMVVVTLVKVKPVTAKVVLAMTGALRGVG